MTKKDARDCFILEIFLEYMKSFDRLLLVDKVHGWINWVESEYRARACYGLEQAFRHVTRREHWQKPANAPKTWRTKVDWMSARKLDPRFGEKSEFSHSGADQEAQASMHQEAAMAQARSKLAEFGPAEITDPLNPVAPP